MNVSLNSQMARFVEEQVKAGRYDSPEDIVNGALAKLRTEEELSAEELQELRTEIALGLEQADRGDINDWNVDEIRAEGQRLLAEAKKRPTGTLKDTRCPAAA